MKQGILAIALLCLLGCKNEVNETDWLQSGSVQLTQPLISSSSRIIDSSVMLTAELRIPDVEIFYTNDGSEPSKESQKYSDAIQISKAGTYKFKAYHHNWKPSETSVLELVKKGLDIDSIYLHTSLTKSYPGNGDKTIIDHQKGKLNYNDKNWLGFDTIVKADLFFKEKTYVKSANLGYLVSTGAWIFPPEEVEIWSSENGNDFTELITHKLDTPSNNLGPESKSIVLSIDAEVRALRIILKNTEEIPEWHPAKGNAGWLFMDEWIFY